MRKYYVLVSCLFLFLSFPPQLSAVTTEGQIQFYDEVETSSDVPLEEKEIKKEPSVPVVTPKKAKQSLLQTSDAVNYWASIVGCMILIYVIHKIRRKI